MSDIASSVLSVIENVEGDTILYIYEFICFEILLQLWKFNFARREWSLLPTDGSMPIELASHAGNLKNH